MESGGRLEFALARGLMTGRVASQFDRRPDLCTLAASANEGSCPKLHLLPGHCSTKRKTAACYQEVGFLLLSTSRASPRRLLCLHGDRPGASACVW